MRALITGTLVLTLISFSLQAKRRGFRNKLLKKDKIRANVSLNYAYFGGDSKMNLINLAGSTPQTGAGGLVFAPGGRAFNFFDPQLSGFSIDYGWDKNMQLSASISVFGLLSSEGTSLKQGLGPLKLGLLYQADQKLGIDSFAVIINPFLSIPFLQFGSDVLLSSFEQPFGMGLSTSLETFKTKGINWGFLGSFSLYFEREKDGAKYGKGYFASFAGFITYKLKSKDLTKFYLIYDTPNLNEDGIGFGDGTLALKAVYEMDWDKTSKVNFGLWYRFALTDKSPLNKVTNIGLSVSFTKNL